MLRGLVVFSLKKSELSEINEWLNNDLTLPSHLFFKLVDSSSSVSSGSAKRPRIEQIPAANLDADDPIDKDDDEDVSVIHGCNLQPSSSYLL